MREEPLVDFNPWPGVAALLCVLGMYFGTLIQKSYYDMPEEFNIHTISQDRAAPTEMMVIYDTINHKYLFEFTDK